MIGIYKITNTQTNHIYIGQSTNIERRWMEHKTPKAYGNDLLHGDMKKYGINNFKFEVIEECEPNELLKRENFFIKKLNPFYNTVGKSVPQKRKKLLSQKNKEWWLKLPESTKQKIIKNNLTGPKKGHTVSTETRQKISKKISKVQKVKVICLETGAIFESIGDFEKSVGACTGTCAAYWKGKIKTVKGYHVEKCRD